MRETQPEWVKRALATQLYHVNSVQANPHHSYRDTAAELKRALGSIQQDLMLASFLQTHEDKLLRMDSAKDAIEFCKKIKKEQRNRITYG